jgi:hypothetical protein
MKKKTEIKKKAVKKPVLSKIEEELSMLAQAQGGYFSKGAYFSIEDGHIIHGGYNIIQGGYNNILGGYNNIQGGYNNIQGGYNNIQGGYIVIQRGSTETEKR